jgi:hypothetical protein
MPAVVDVLSDLVRAERARDDRGDNWMGKGELEVAAASGVPWVSDSLNPGHPIHLFRRGVPVVALHRSRDRNDLHL